MGTAWVVTVLGLVVGVICVILFGVPSCRPPAAHGCRSGRSGRGGRDGRSGRGGRRGGEEGGCGGEGEDDRSTRLLDPLSTQHDSMTTTAATATATATTTTTTTTIEEVRQASRDFRIGFSSDTTTARTRGASGEPASIKGHTDNIQSNIGGTGGNSGNGGTGSNGGSISVAWILPSLFFTVVPRMLLSPVIVNTKLAFFNQRGGQPGGDSGGCRDQPGGCMSTLVYNSK